MAPTDGTQIDFILLDRVLMDLPMRLGDTRAMPGATRIGEAIALLHKLCHDRELAEFLTLLGYVPIDAKGEGGWQALKDRMRKGAVHAFYFSVAPALFGDIAAQLTRTVAAAFRIGVQLAAPFLVFGLLFMMFNNLKDGLLVFTGSSVESNE